MSTENDEETNGTPKRASASEVGEEGLPAEFARHLGEVALEFRGGLTPVAAIQIALRNTDQRNEILHELSRSSTPQNVDLNVWARWMKGGKPPFIGKPDKPLLDKPTNGSERPANLVTRTSPRVSDQEKTVAKKQAELKQEEEHLALLRAHDSAALHFVIENRLISILEPLFAMGPAWTIMRALSAHVSDEVANDATEFMQGKEKDFFIAKMRTDRIGETERVLKVLDYLSGVWEFEEALRAAVVKVVDEFGAKSEELVKDGRRPRGKETMATSIHPKAQHEAEEVLEGLKKAS